MNRHALARILLLQVCLILLSARTGALGQEPLFNVVSPGQGIGGSALQAIMQDSQGFIWLGTSSGIYRFDGIRYTPAAADDTLRGASFTAMFQSADGTIWAGTGKGLLATLRNERLTLFDPEEGNPACAITGIVQDARGNIWFSTYGEGAYCLSGGKIFNFSSDDGLGDDYTYTIAPDHQGSVWIGSDRGISVCGIDGDKKRVSTLTTADGLPDNIVREIHPEGEWMWICMQDGGICRMNAVTHEVAVPPQLVNWPYGTVNDLVVSGNRLWAGTDDHGIVSLDTDNNGPVQAFPKPGGIEHLKITRLAIDREENIWFLAGNAMIRTPGSRIEVLSPAMNPGFSNIHAILCDRSHDIWFSNDEGLFRYRTGSGAAPEPFIQNRNFSGTHFISLYQDPYGYLWIGTFGSGLLRLDPATRKVTRFTTADGLANDNVLSITGTADELWFATLGGASRCKIPSAVISGAKQLRFEGFDEESGLGNNFIYSVFADSKQRIWFATDGEGISVRDNGRFVNYADSAGKAGLVVYSVTEGRDGRIWFSTASQGLYSFDGSAFRNYTTASGLSDPGITSLKASAQGGIFIVHENGIDVLDPASGGFNYFGTEDGLRGIKPDLNAITSDPEKGLIWIGTSKGIIKLETKPYGRAEQPAIRLTGVRVFLAATDTSASHVFPHNRNHFTFDFAGLWYKAPERVAYQVMLEGYDLDWIPTRNASVTYSSLGPGSYTFRVRASLNDSFPNAEVAAYHFTVRAPVWQTWWFIALLLLLAGAAVYAVIRIREQRLRREEALKKENILFQFETLKSQVNPHFLFNSFSTLSAIIDDDKAMALDYVQKLAAFFRNILEYRDRSVITVEEELSLLDNYYFIQKKRYGDHLTLVTDLPSEYRNTYIPPLTLQLIFENAVKHNVVSAARPLTVRITAEGDTLSVTNNRQAKAELPPSTGTGLTNIRNRYRLLVRKEIEITATPAEFRILLPVIKNHVS